MSVFAFTAMTQARCFAGTKTARSGAPMEKTSRLTFKIYLNDGFDGGETLFEDVTVEPATGMALVFRHPLLHEGGEIFAGRKSVLRTDVMYAAEPCELPD